MTEQTAGAVPQLGELKGTGRLLFGPFATKGNQVDAWADVIEDMTEKAQDVLNAFDERVRETQVPLIDVRDEIVSGRGFEAEQRSYRIFQRGPGVMAVYVAGWGKDLYVSWRLFAGPLSHSKIRNWLIATAVIGLLPGLCFFCTGLGGAGVARKASDTLGSLCFGLFGLLATMAGSAMFFSIFGILFGLWLAGDALWAWREKLDEFAQDEVAALAIDLHKKLLGAIDAVGLDASQLVKKEDFALAGRKRLI